MEQTYPFQLPSLPYSESFLEPVIDQKTVHIHYYKHVKSYVEKLNETLACYPEYHCCTLRQLIKRAHNFPPKIRTDVKNYAGGVLNHLIYFYGMDPSAQLEDAPCLLKKIQQRYSTYEEFQVQFSQAATRQFGSGYAWLCLDNGKQLRIITTQNQDNPLAYGLRPILTIDVWEHAYYLQYQNKRTDYIEQYFSLINWSRAEQLFRCATQNQPAPYEQFKKRS